MKSRLSYSDAPPAVSRRIAGMTRDQQPQVTIFAMGFAALGILSVISRDFAYQWEPVPNSIPGREVLAVLSGLLMIAVSAGLLFRATAPIAVRVLFPFLLIWQLLKLPAVLVAPGMEAVWLGFCEITALLAGGWMLFANLAEWNDSPLSRHITGEEGIRIARVLFGAALIPIGLSHIVYADVTAGFVPAWLPYRSGWAYLTGVGQIACGVVILLSVFARLAAYIEAAMLAIFAFLVWAPPTLKGPHRRFPMTAFLITWVIGASAAIVAKNIPDRRR